MLRSHGRKRQLRWVIGALMLLTMLAWAKAQLAPELSKGLQWLSEQVNADASIENEAGAPATPSQVRYETHETLSRMGRLVQSLRDWVGMPSDGNTEYLARQVVQLALADRPDAGMLTQLSTRQNNDGGFGGARGYASHPLDTAFALLAYEKSLALSPEQIRSAVEFLTASRNADGGWGKRGVSSIYDTAMVVLAASAVSRVNNSAAVAASGREWLLARRSNGTFGSVLHDAVGLLALARQTSDTTVINPLVSSLKAAQAANGSWSDDPYLTALALRALWFVGKGEPASDAMVVNGTVLDAGSKTPIGDAVIEVVQNTALNASSDQAGAFSISSVPPGTYTLRISKLGYEARQMTVSGSAGELVALGQVLLRQQSLTATLTGVVRTTSGSPIHEAIVSIGSSSVLTGVDGAYQLSGLNPGAATIVVTKAGYLGANAAANFEPGRSYIFSPTLYVGGALPTTATLRGRVIGANGTALAGAQVTLGTTTRTTGVDGRFEFAGLAAQAFALSISASGHGTVSASGTLINGVNDVGNISLSQLPATSTLVGKVIDATSGVAIPGAVVRLVGTSLAATTDAGGSYSMTNVSTLTFTLSAAAPGYAPLSYAAKLDQPGSATFDFRLSSEGAGLGLRLESVQTSKASYSPFDELKIELDVVNAGSSASAGVVDAQVFDAQGRLALELKANAKGLGQFPINNPITLPAGASTPVAMETSIIRHEGGPYTALVRLADTSGRIVDQVSVPFTVSAEPILNGGVLPNPPIAQAGTSMPISIKAEVGNNGNVPVPAGDLVLTVTAESVDGNDVSPLQASVTRMAATAPLNGARSMARDSAGNLFVANAGDGRVLKITPSGESSVYYTLPSSKLPNFTDASVDANGVLWLATSYAKVFTISPSLELSEFQMANLSNLASIHPQADGSLLAVGTFYLNNETRLVRRSAAGIETILSSGGLSSPYGVAKLPSGELLVPNYGDGTLSRVQPSTGQISPVASGLGRPAAVTVGPDGNYYVADSSQGSGILRVSPLGAVSVYATGVSNAADLKFAPSGELFVSSSAANAIYRVPTGGGSATLFSRGTALSPAGIKYDSIGNLYLTSADSTVRVLDTQGKVRSMASGVSAPRGIAVLDVDDVLVASFTSGAIRRVTPGGSSNLITGLSNPWGVAVDGGIIYVTENGQPRISRYGTDGKLIDALETAFNAPTLIRLGTDGSRLIRHAGNRWVKLTGDVATPLASTSFDDLVADPFGVGYIASRARDIFRVDANGLETRIVTLSFAPAGIGVATDGSIVAGDYSGRRIIAINPTSGALSTLATLPELPRAILTDRNGIVYVNYGGRIDRVDANGSQVTVTPSGWGEYIMGTVAAPDGQLTIWTNYARVYALSPTSRSTQLLGAASGIPDSAVQVSPAQYVAAWTSANEVATHSVGTGAIVGRVAGFTALRDIAVTPTGVHFMDGNQRLYRWAPGSYPVRIAEGFAASYLAAKGSEVYGASSSAIVAWDGSKRRDVFSIPGGGLALAGLAFDSQGRLAAADGSYSRVFLLNQSLSAVESQYTGLSWPTGLLFDATGRLLVADLNLGSIARYSTLSDGANAELYAVVPGARYLDMDPTGKIVVAGGNRVYQLDSNATPSLLASNINLNFEGIAATTAGIYVIDRPNSAVRAVRNGGFEVVTAGMSAPSRVRMGADGRAYISNRGNGTVSVYAAGAQQSFTSGLTSPTGLELLPDGRWLVTGGSGSAHFIAADGQLTDLNIDNLLPVGAQGHGIATLNASTFMLLHEASGSGSLHKVEVQQAQVPPVPGTVVHQTTRPLGGLAVDSQLQSIDFGNWTPKYSGHYKIEASMSGVPGSLVNYLHVGPHAKGVLGVARNELPPGDQSVGMTLNLTGADFTSVSRVETGLVKLLVANERPYGMVGDKAGNLWYTNGNSLRRTRPDGVSELVVGSLLPAFGLAVDSDERFYLPNRVNGRYHLMRVLKDGSSSLLADLGVTSAAGVAVNSRNEILVGTPGKLLKVDPITGGVSTVTTAGIPAPRGIAIDAQDNLYVQNESDVVTLIRPDGSSRVIFDRADGVNDPVFEGDGYPTIAADCAENFYIAPFIWSKVNQQGEEHTLAQVTARTGRVSTVFDALKINSALGDIDYLAFDRFNNRILMWADYVNQIWQAPVTCGAIGVEAHVVTRPGQALSAFSRAPNAQSLLPDGRTEYVWSLRDVGSAGHVINFDTTLQGLSLGDSRDAVQSAFLQFHNSFSSSDIRLPIDVPKVHVGNLLTLTETIDKSRYQSGDSAIIGVALTNPSASPVVGELVVEVRDAAGQVTGRPIQQNVSLLPSEPLHLGGVVGIESQLPGAYRSVAELRANGRLVAQAVVGFEIVATAGLQPAAATLALDKSSYAPAESVRITSRVVNPSQNQPVDGLKLQLRVLAADDRLVSEKLLAVGQLLPGKSVEFLTLHALATAAPGTYRVEQQLLDSALAMIDRDVASFVVQSTQGTGAGLSGMLNVTPAAATVAVPVSLGWTVSNGGNAPLAGLPLRIRIVDPSPTATVLAELQHAADLPVGQTASGALSWTPATAQIGKSLLAVLEAQAGGQWLVLGQDSFSVMAPPAQVEASVSGHREARVLALVSCPPGSDGGTQSALPADGQASCAMRRAEALSRSFGALGIVHKAVTSRAEFESELRCGAYNTYWISGGADQLGDQLRLELGELVRRGDALVAEGLSSWSDLTLLNLAAGVLVQGKLATADQGITFTGSAQFPAGNLPTLGWPTKYYVQPGAQVHARFADTSAAVVTYSLGLGRSAVLAFEFTRMLERLDADDTAQQALLRQVLQVVAGEATRVPVGAPAALALKLRNVGQQAASTQVQAILPVGLNLLAHSDPTNWQVELAPGEERTIVVRVQAQQEGDQTLRFNVNAGAQAQTVPMVVQVQTLQQLSQQAQAQVQASVARDSFEQGIKESALQAIAQAQALTQQQRHDEALVQWLQVAITLMRFQSAQDAAVAVAHALQASERMLCPQLACLVGGVQFLQGTQPSSNLQANTSGLLRREVTNVCSAALPQWQITSRVSNRRSAQQLLQMQDAMALGAGQSNVREMSFTATGQATDVLEALLFGERLGLQHYLGRTTLQLTPLVCDVDGNGAINLLDIQLLQRSIGQPVPLGDPRDANGDGRVTNDDERACTLRCTKPGCAQ